MMLEYLPPFKNIQMSNNISMTESFQPDPEYLIEDLETLKLIADPLRIDILETVSQHARPAKEIAELLNREPSKLYYHINLLEKRGLIRVVQTHVVSGIIEKIYRSAAKSIRVAPHLLSTDHGDDAGLEMVLTTFFDNSRAALKRSFQEGLISLDPAAENRPFLLHTRLRLTQAQFQELQESMMKILESVSCDSEATAPEQQVYSLTVALYPTVASGEIEIS